MLKADDAVRVMDIQRKLARIAQDSAATIQARRLVRGAAEPSAVRREISGPRQALAGAGAGR